MRLRPNQTETSTALHSGNCENKMNEQEQRIAIGAACGATWGHPVFNHDGKWHVHFDKDPFEFDSSWAGKPPPFEECEKELDVPDYLDDLGAMHEAEKHIVEAGGCYTHYVSELQILTEHNEWRATAAQRAEAFLKCIGKWTDTDPKAREGG
jgi:hypothetical protein